MSYQLEADRDFGEICRGTCDDDAGGVFYAKGKDGEP